MIPERTSPDPPVARPGFPVRLTSTLPVGSEMTVGAPFSRTTTPWRCAKLARRVDRIGEHLPQRDPREMRAISPGWGVRTGTGRIGSASGIPPAARAFRPSASTRRGPFHAFEELPDEPVGLGMASESGAEDERIPILAQGTGGSRAPRARHRARVGLGEREGHRLGELRLENRVQRSGNPDPHQARARAGGAPGGQAGCPGQSRAIPPR